MRDGLVVLFGGSGFIGRYAAQALMRRGARVRFAERDPRRAVFLRTLGGIGQSQFVAADLLRRLRSRREPPTTKATRPVSRREALAVYRRKAARGDRSHVRTEGYPAFLEALAETTEADIIVHGLAFAEVVYLGDTTRFLVDLDAGGRLTAVQQNLETSSEDVAAFRGSRVRLQWHHRHNFPVEETP